MERRSPPERLRWEEFGSWIAANQRMSDRELSRTAGVSNTHISVLKRGLHSTTLDKVIAIAAALGRPPREALAVLGLNEEDMSAEAIEVAGLVDELDPDKRRAFANVARALAESMSAG